METSAPLVAVIMGSKSDWETMRAAVETLAEFAIPTETRVISAHRTPELMADFAREAAARGIQVIIAGAGGAAHLPPASQSARSPSARPVQKTPRSSLREFSRCTTSASARRLMPSGKSRRMKFSPPN
jgi:5-(carboxyamino)imidazole ribonucleotide mutase